MALPSLSVRRFVAIPTPRVYTLQASMLLAEGRCPCVHPGRVEEASVMASSASMFNGLNLRAMLPASKYRRMLAVDVTACLRNAIQTGLLPDGIELNQVALAEHLGVSRVPVREAMRSLQAEGWISARANYRATVQAVSAERIKQIFELRTLLEVHCLRRAVR